MKNNFLYIFFYAICSLPFPPPNSTNTFPHSSTWFFQSFMFFSNLSFSFFSSAILSSHFFFSPPSFHSSLNNFIPNFFSHFPSSSPSSHFSNFSTAFSNHFFASFNSLSICCCCPFFKGLKKV